MELLTYPSVEESIKKRVEMKARTYWASTVGQYNKDGRDPVYKINPSLVADLYGDWIMPLTKEVQVEYLLRRLDRLEGIGSEFSLAADHEIEILWEGEGVKLYGEK